VLSHLANFQQHFKTILYETTIEINRNFEVVDFMTSETLKEAIASSELVISRSGYSTVMDLAMMQAKAMFIPTPGQTEQEYLTENLMKRGIAYSEKQESFELSMAIEKSKVYEGFNFEMKDELHRHVQEMINFSRTLCRAVTLQ